MANFVERSVMLYYQQGTSDKVYSVAIYTVGVMPSKIKRNTTFTVEVGWGRRGQPLRRMTKTTQPCSLTTAITMYDKIVREKKLKGYRKDGQLQEQEQHDAVVIPTKPKKAFEPEYYQGFSIAPETFYANGGADIVDTVDTKTVHTVEPKRTVTATINQCKKLIDKKKLLTSAIQKAMRK